MSYGFMIEMHDLIQEMDREIIHQESIKDPKRWSQSWKHDECLMHVLKYNRVNGMCNYVYLILLISFLNVASMVAFVNYYSFFFVFQGTNVVEGIILDFHKVNENLNLSSNSLARMTKLRLLRINETDQFKVWFLMVPCHCLIN